MSDFTEGLEEYGLDIPEYLATKEEMQEEFKQVTMMLRQYTLHADITSLSDDEYKEGVREILKNWLEG